jgi:prephenate dehydrogenase
MGDRGDSNMKIVIIGGTGLIGTKLVNNLRQRGWGGSFINGEVFTKLVYKGVG